MDKNLNLKRRILGGFVTVLAIAVILPAVLDSSRYSDPLFAEAPPMPDVPDWAQVESPQRVRQELQELASGDATRAIEPAPVTVVEKDEPVPVAKPQAVEQTPAPVAKTEDKNDFAQAWTLQLGAFSEAKNAYALRDQLRKKGYKAYTEELPNDKLTRVYVGPEIARENIETLQKKLQGEMGQSDIHIKRWQPGR